MKKQIFSIVLTLAALSASAQGLRLERLAGDYLNIRVPATEQSKYLLLPVEEAAPESQMSIISNGSLVRTLNVRLAVNKVDYEVPVLLDEFRNQDLVLTTHMNIDHSNRGGVGSEPRLTDIRLSNTFDDANREPYRLAYHHSPAYGWMNDPNGMFYLDGTWHLYYQYNPYGSMWGNMHWGHATSTDLTHWQSHGVVLSPDALGTIFSGSCVVDKNGTAGFGKNAVVAMYTSCIQTPYGHDVQTQSLAYSTDGGMTFTKYSGNPVLSSTDADFRDPNPFWNEQLGKWNLIMACGQEMRIYSSPNLKEWTEESRFGEGLGSHAGVWECPDLMELPIEGTADKKWVLICNINPGGPAGGSATQYFVGDFDGKTFTPDYAARYTDGKALWQDYGMDHYATVSFNNAPGGRHTMMAWMSNWLYANEVPTQQFRSSNSIAREPYLYKVGSELFLGSRPSPEYEGAGLDQTVKVKGNTTITLSNDRGESFVITYDQKAMTLTADRSKSGKVDFNHHFAEKLIVAPVHKKLTQIRIFVDKGSVEVFGNNGEVCLTNLVFPQSQYNHVMVK